MNRIDEVILKVRKDVQTCEKYDCNCNICELVINGECAKCYGSQLPYNFYEHLCYLTKNTDEALGITKEDIR